ETGWAGAGPPVPAAQGGGPWGAGGMRGAIRSRRTAWRDRVRAHLPPWEITMQHGFRGCAMAALRLLCLGAGLAAAAHPAAAATLQINELLAGPARDWDGSGTVSTRDDEWVEVKNVSGATLDLAGFLLTDGDSLPRIALTGTLAPGERRVVYGRESYDWERANGYPAFGLSLGNSGDAVILWQVQGADTVVVDAYAYRSHEAAADRAVGR